MEGGANVPAPTRPTHPLTSPSAPHPHMNQLHCVLPLPTPPQASALPVSCSKKNLPRDPHGTGRNCHSHALSPPWEGFPDCVRELGLPVPKQYRQGGLDNRVCRLPNLEAGRLRSRCPQGCLLPRPLSWACRWPPPLHVFTWPSLRVCLCLL